MSKKLASAGVCADDTRRGQDDENDSPYDDGCNAYHVTPSLVIAQALFDPVFT